VGLWNRVEIALWYEARTTPRGLILGSLTGRCTFVIKVEALVLAQLLEDGGLPGSKKIPTLSDFASRFFPWLAALPADRPPKEPTKKKYYRTGWKLREKTSMAGRRLDHITPDHIASLVCRQFSSQH
jgi:hypothetical protein